jgi:hypothetical protein
VEEPEGKEKLMSSTTMPTRSREKQTSRSFVPTITTQNIVEEPEEKEKLMLSTTMPKTIQTVQDQQTDSFAPSTDSVLIMSESKSNKEVEMLPTTIPKTTTLSIVNETKQRDQVKIRAS